MIPRVVVRRATGPNSSLRAVRFLSTHLDNSSGLATSLPHSDGFFGEDKKYGGAFIPPPLVPIMEGVTEASGPHASRRAPILASSPGAPPSPSTAVRISQCASLVANLVTAVPLFHPQAYNAIKTDPSFLSELAQLRKQFIGRSA